MKNLKRQKHDVTEDINASLEFLFGSEVELGNDELEAELEECGVDAVSLDEKAYVQLKASAHHHFVSLEKEVPAAMAAALRQLRPPDEQEKRIKVAEGAASRVKSILSAVSSGAAGVVRNVVPPLERSPEYAFRNKGELTQRDLGILEDGNRELNDSKDAQGEDDE